MGLRFHIVRWNFSELGLYPSGAYSLQSGVAVVAPDVNQALHEQAKP